MMFPNRHASAPPAPGLTPMPPAFAPALDEEGDRLPHTDYNLHPLVVEGLDHYVALDDQKECFSVR